jgi:hypothetical protein
MHNKHNACLNIKEYVFTNNKFFFSINEKMNITLTCKNKKIPQENEGF